MPRKPATALTRLDTLTYKGRPVPPRHEEDEDEDEDEDAEDAECLLCSLEDNDDGQSLRKRFALALAYGCKVLARGDAISTCEDCNNAIAVEIDGLTRELRKMKRAGARKR